MIYYNDIKIRQYSNVTYLKGKNDFRRKNAELKNTNINFIVRIMQEKNANLLNISISKIFVTLDFLKPFSTKLKKTTQEQRTRKIMERYK